MYKYSTRFGLLPGEKADGTRAIRLRVSWSGRRVDLCLPVGVPSECWDQSAEKAVNSKSWKDCGKINSEISKYRLRIEEFMERSFLDRTIPGVEDMKKAISGKAPQHITISEAIPLFISNQSVLNSWTDTTEGKFRVLSKHLSRAGLVTFDDITEEGLQRFVESLIEEGLANSTIGKQIGFLKWFLRWCLKNGYLSSDRFELWKPKLKNPPKEVIFLTWEELERFYNFKFGPRHPGLESVRDVFCFCAFTGLRHSDVEKLTWADVEDDCISVVTKKTNDPLRIELNKFSKAILDKYRKTIPGGIPRGKSKALPAISNQKANVYLKEAAKLADISSQVKIVRYYGSERVEETFYKYDIISTHAARRTFVVNALRLGIPSEVIMKWTGHSGFASMKPYVAIVDEIKRESMDKFNKL